MEESHVIIAISIFIATYGIIISEKIHRTTVAMFGAVIMLMLHVLSQEAAIDHIDFNTIGLLIGMMIMVGITRRTGVFEYIAIKAAKTAKGDPWKIIVLLSIVTAVASALLDNVTTILLIVPVTLVITDTLEINPIAFLIPEVLVANIGGTATLIGDPPNIMIGSAANLGFMDFIINLLPVVVIIFIVIMFILKIIYKKSLSTTEEAKQRILSMNEKIAIKNELLLKKSLSVLAFTIIGFTLHESFGFESATVALTGAAILLLISKIEPEEIFVEIEWTTIFFFMALFILVGSLEEVGVIGILAEKMVSFTNGNLFVTTMLILWVSAIASAFLDNIPFVATMIPLVKGIGAMSAMSITPLWWALALGACLGGNGSIVGATANVVVSGMLEKHGNRISFVDYLKIGFPLMIVSVAISSVYLIMFYL